MNHAADPPTRSDVVEEAADVVLKKDDEGDGAHRDKLVEDGAHEAHLEHLREEQPHDDEYHDAHEDVERAGLAHQTVDVIEHQGNEQNVDEVFYSEADHDGRLYGYGCEG